MLNFFFKKKTNIKFVCVWNVLVCLWEWWMGTQEFEIWGAQKPRIRTCSKTGAQTPALAGCEILSEIFWEVAFPQDPGHSHSEGQGTRVERTWVWKVWCLSLCWGEMKQTRGSHESALGPWVDSPLLFGVWEGRRRQLWKALWFPEALSEPTLVHGWELRPNWLLLRGEKLRELDLQLMWVSVHSAPFKTHPSWLSWEAPLEITQAGMAEVALVFDSNLHE